MAYNCNKEQDSFITLYDKTASACWRWMEEWMERRKRYEKRYFQFHCEWGTVAISLLILASGMSMYCKLEDRKLHMSEE